MANRPHETKLFGHPLNRSDNQSLLATTNSKFIIQKFPPITPITARHHQFKIHNSKFIILSFFFFETLTFFSHCACALASSKVMGGCLDMSSILNLARSAKDIFEFIFIHFFIFLRVQRYCFFRICQKH